MAHLAQPLVAPYLAQGQLVTLLQGWSSMRPGIFIYFPSRRQMPMPLQVFLIWRKRAGLVHQPA